MLPSSGKAASDFIKQLKEAMGNDNINSHKLSMRFNVDMYVGDSEQSNFTTGRISGLMLNNSYNQYLCLMLTFLCAYYVLLCFGLFAALQVTSLRIIATKTSDSFPA